MMTERKSFFGTPAFWGTFRHLAHSVRHHNPIVVAPPPSYFFLGLFHLGQLFASYNPPPSKKIALLILTARGLHGNEQRKTTACLKGFFPAAWGWDSVCEHLDAHGME